MASSELYYARIRIIDPILRDIFEECKNQGVFRGTFLAVILALELEDARKCSGEGHACNPWGPHFSRSCNDGVDIPDHNKDIGRL